MILLNSSFVAAGTTVTTSATRRLKAGWFVYSNAVVPGTTVETILTPSTFTISQPAVATLTGATEYTYAQPGVWHERNCALLDVEQMCRERGALIELHLLAEADTTRGSYGGIQARGDGTLLSLYAYPIEFSPSVRRLEKAGLREECNAVIYCPVKTFIDAGIDFDNLTINNDKGVDVRRSWALLDGSKYELKEKAKVGQFADSWEYFTLALVKR